MNIFWVITVWLSCLASDVLSYNICSKNNYAYTCAKYLCAIENVSYDLECQNDKYIIWRRRGNWNDFWVPNSHSLKNFLLKIWPRFYHNINIYEYSFLLIIQNPSFSLEISRYMWFHFYYKKCLSNCRQISSIATHKLFGIFLSFMRMKDKKLPLNQKC